MDSHVTKVPLTCRTAVSHRTQRVKEYKLDPIYFVSTPGLSLEACLKLSKVKLELLTDLDMLLMFEKGIRGSISQAIHKYAKSNNK